MPPAYSGYTAGTTIHPRPTILTGAGETASLLSAQFQYSAVTAGNVRAFVKRYNGAGVTPTSVTEKFNSRSIGSTVPANTWATAPAAVGNSLVIQDAGERAGQFGNRWTPARPYAAIIAIDGEEIGTDDSTTTSATTAQYMSWREDVPDTKIMRGRRVRGSHWLYGNYKSTAALASSGRNRRNLVCYDRNRRFYRPTRSMALDVAAGPGPQNVSITGFQNAAQFGAVKADQTVNITGFQDAAQFGATAAAITVPITGFQNATQFGTLVRVDQTVPVVGLQNAAQFGVLSVDQTVPLTGFLNDAQFGAVSPTIGTPVAITGFQNAAQFGVVSADQTVPISGLLVSAQFGGPVPSQTVNLTGFSSPAQFGPVTISTGTGPAASTLRGRTTMGVGE